LIDISGVFFYSGRIFMHILGIESSCDETAIALVEQTQGTFRVLKSALTSQVDLHALYGGVVPEVAAREHASHIFPLLESLGILPDGSEVDVIAVTAGPGLVPALRIGVELGKTLAYLWNKPIVAVNHLEGHMYSVWLQEPTPVFPAVSLLVSGGHTELILMKDHGVYELVGMTRDDAAGEAFDKVAKLVGLSYPGGPAVSKAALQGNPKAIDFPRPMLESDGYDVSFSGLKTAVRLYVESHTHYSLEDVCASFQEAVVETLVIKTLKAVLAHAPKSVILSGGVSANRSLRERLHDQLAITFPDITFHAPELSVSGDNAVMIAIAAAFHANKKEYANPLTLEADPNMRLVVGEVAK